MDDHAVADRARHASSTGGRTVTFRLDPREFADLAKSLGSARTIEQTADQVVEHARAALGAAHGGITLVRPHGKLETVAASDDLVVKADQLQSELQDGPSFDDSWHGRTVASQSLVDDRRWSRWAPRVSSLGISAFLAAELTGTDTARLGALNLYWSAPVVFTADDLAYVSIFATHAAIALESSVQEMHLNTALDTRKLIGQAQGILMERHKLSTEQAFEVLRRYSQEHNVKLRDVARRLVDTRQLPSRDVRKG